MALAARVIKIPHRVRYERGYVAGQRKLWIKPYGSASAADVFVNETSRITEVMDQPLYSLQDGTFPGYVHPGRYDVYLDDESSTPIVWDAIGVLSQWRVIGETDDPAFTNSWTNYGGGYQPCGFQKDAFGIVRLRGAVKSGTVSTSIFTLPVGYRPGNPAATPGNYWVASIAAAGAVQIGDDGKVVAPAANTFVPLGGIKFKAEA